MRTCHRARLTASLLTGAALIVGTASAQEIATGIVFEDLNGNGLHDPGEPGVAGVAVSNGLDVVLTDDEGRYELPVDGDTIIFVRKPSGWAVPLDEDNLPQFFYIHKPEGGPDFEFPTVPPTGPLPESISFPLERVEESNQFSIIGLADPQPRNYEQVLWVEDKVVNDMARQEDIRFTIVHGDIVHNDLSLLEPWIDMARNLGHPIYNVIGNHDLNLADASGPEDAGETFQYYFGPEDFSWQSGDVHFVAMNSIKYHGHERGGYHTELDERQLEWLRNDLETANPEKLLVINMHSTFINQRGGRRMPGIDQVLEMTKDRPAGVLVLNGHKHYTILHYYTEEDGWEGEADFFELNQAVGSGRWWRGPKDYRGVPVAIQGDGTPQGYTIIRFDGTDYTYHYRGAGYPEDYQMRIFAPTEHTSGENPERTLLANIFYAPPTSEVEYSLNGGGWQPMEYNRRPDPLTAGQIHGWPEDIELEWGGAGDAFHMWEVVLDEELPPGRSNRWDIRATKPNGQVVTGTRIFTTRE